MHRVIFIPAAAILTLTACGQGAVRNHVDFYTARGVFIETHGLDIDQEEVQAGIDLFIKLMVETDPATYGKGTLEFAFLTHPLRISFMWAKISCRQSPTGYSLGIQRNDDLMVYQRGGDNAWSCIGYGSLGHELIHWARQRVEKFQDADHIDPRYFRGVAAMEGKWQREMIARFCTEGKEIQDEQRQQNAERNH